MQDLSQDNGQFSTAYINFWNLNAIPALRDLEGFPTILDFPGDPEGFRDALSNFLANNQDIVRGLHEEAQVAANAGNDVNGSNPFLEPGTPEFQAAFDDITSRISFSEGGTRFFDRSALALSLIHI